MAEKKTKPSSKQLAELQDLYTALESDVGIGKVDEKLLQKFEQGELSKADADKLRGELNQAMEKFQVKQLGPAETGLQVRTPAASERALTTTPGQAVMPTTLTPEVVSARPRAALPPAQPGVIDATVIPESKVLLNAERPGALAVREGDAAVKNLVQVAERNPVIKKLMLPFAVAAGVGGTLWAGWPGQEQKAESKVLPPPSPTPGPTPPSAPTPAPAPAPGPSQVPSRKETGIAPPRVVKAPPMDFSSTVKNMEAIFQEYQKGRQLPEEQRKAFSAKQDEIKAALNSAKEIYNKTISKAESEADRREAMTRWASIAESFSQSLIKFFAAREGARTGQLLGSKLAFEKYDWQKDLDSSLGKLKRQTDEAKAVLGIAREEAETEMKGVEAERKAALQAREEIAGKRFGLLSDVEKEKIRQQSKSVEEYTQAVNRAELERYQQDMAGQRTEETAQARKEVEQLKAEAKAKEAETKTGTKTAGIAGKALDAFVTGFGDKKKREAQRGDMEAQLKLLGATEQELKRLNELMNHTWGQGDSADLSEARTLINSIEQRRLGAASPAGQTAPVVPAAPTTTEAMVDMIAPDGRELKVPASRVAEMETKGARRK